LSGPLLTDSPAPHVAVLTLNRPDALNAMTAELCQALHDELERLGRDRSVRTIVLTGAGRAFCAGLDLRGYGSAPGNDGADAARDRLGNQEHMSSLVLALRATPQPVIAAVNGPAAGLGCDLALCCDFILASEAARFAMSFVLRGLVPDGGGMYFLPRRVGLARAKELIFTGRTVDAREALAIGLADRIASAATLLDEARAWAAELGRGSSAALALAKSILDKSFELSADEVLALSREAQAICYTTTEHRDAVEAFLNKSKPKS